MGEWGKRALPLLISASLFGLYLFSAYPTVSPYRDSGDLSAAASVLGVPHAPGYPLYVLAAHAWLTLFPIGNVAYRLHVLSALFGACAVLLLIKLFVDTNLGADSLTLLGGIAAGLFVGLSPAFWHLSLTSEMYSLNALFAAGLMALVYPRTSPLSSLPVRHAGPLRAEGDNGELLLPRFFATALIFGLGLGNHQTLILAALGLAWIAWRPSREYFEALDAGARTGALLSVVGMMLLGLSVYLYLPLRSWADPWINWGEPHTLRQFLRMLTRADYGAIRLHPERPAGFLNFLQWINGLKIALRMLVEQLGWSGAAACLWGIIAFRKNRAAQGAALAGFASGPIFIGWANMNPSWPETMSILEPHLVLPIVFFGFLAGLGIADFLRRFNRHSRVFVPVAMAAALAAWIIPLRSAWADLTVYRRDYSAWDYGRAVLDIVEPDAMILDPDDTAAFALAYLQTCEHRRPDVHPILFFRTFWGYHQIRRRHPEFLPAWDMRSGQELLGALTSHNLGQGRPIYIDLPQKTPPNIQSVPQALCYRLIRDAMSVDERKRWISRAIQQMSLLRFRPAPMSADFFTQHAVQYWASSLNNLGIEAQRAGLPQEALPLYFRALSVQELPAAWNNLGNARLALHDLPGAEGCYFIAQSLSPSPQLVYNLGRVYLMENRYEDAKRQFDSALQEADFPDARNDLGLVLYHTGRIKDAVRIWRGLLARYPTYSPPLFNLGLAFHDLGDDKSAREALKLYQQTASNPEDRAEAGRWLKKFGG